MLGQSRDKHVFHYEENLKYSWFLVGPFLSAGSTTGNMWSRKGAGQVLVSSEEFLPAKKNSDFLWESLPPTPCQTFNIEPSLTSESLGNTALFGDIHGIDILAG